MSANSLPSSPEPLQRHRRLSGSTGQGDLGDHKNRAVPSAPFFTSSHTGQSCREIGRGGIIAKRDDALALEDKRFLTHQRQNRVTKSRTACNSPPPPARRRGDGVAKTQFTS